MTQTPEAAAQFARVQSLYRQAHAAADRSAWSEALTAIQQALALAPTQPELHYARGNFLAELGEHAAARAAYEAALRERPDFHAAWNNLGLSREAEADREGAEQAYLAALSHGSTVARVNLARCRRRAGDPERALAVCGEPGSAPGEPALRHERVLALLALDRFGEAEAGLSPMTHCGDGERKLWHRLARRLAESNAGDRARALYRRLAESDGDDWLARCGAALLLPVLPESPSAVAHARRAYQAGLDSLLAETRPERLACVPRAELLAALRWNNFYLAYQGENDVVWQRQYAVVLQRFLAALLPDLPSPPAIRRPGPGRIGVVSAFIRDCTVGHYFRAWLLTLAEAGYAVTVYGIDPRDDALTRALRAARIGFVELPADLPAQVGVLRAADPDLLLYPEIGMHAGSQALAALRLAPVQAAAWGHPLTSGLPSVDVYFSCARMEPPGSAAHYSERLCRLPGLGTAYQPPDRPPAAPRAALNLPEGRPLLFYPHALFKIHPDDDATLLAVLRRVPEAVAILFAAEHPSVTESYRRRLQACRARQFSDLGDLSDRVRILPLMPRDRFLQVARHCQAMLDCSRWSGGNTALDALAVGLPVVARAGPTMRARQSAAMLSILGVSHLVARTHDEQVEIVAHHLRDPAAQAENSARILAARSRLFERREPLRALRRFVRVLIGSPEVPRRGQSG